MQIRPGIRHGLRVGGSLIIVLLVLQTFSWIAIGRKQVPPGIAEAFASLDDGHFYLDGASLDDVPPRHRSIVRADLLEHGRMAADRVAEYPDEASGPRSRLELDTWLSTPIFGSFGANVRRGRWEEGRRLRYVWAGFKWVRVPMFDVYRVA